MLRLHSKSCVFYPSAADSHHAQGLRIPAAGNEPHSAGERVRQGGGEGSSASPGRVGRQLRPEVPGGGKQEQGVWKLERRAYSETGELCILWVFSSLSVFKWQQQLSFELMITIIKYEIQKIFIKLVYIKWLARK